VGIAPGERIERSIVAGVPDLFVLHRGIAHMIEIKTPAGELSDPRAMLTRCWGCSMRGAHRGRRALYSNVRWQGRRRAKRNRRVSRLASTYSSRLVGSS
jgi:hypothetical protein